MARPRKSEGFTLIELLVVVAIIALLISILLPSLSKARESARAVACLSNMKQVSLGMTFYLNDYDGSYPLTHNAPTGDQPLYHWNGLLIIDGYTPEVDVYACPTFRSDAVDWTWSWAVPNAIPAENRFYWAWRNIHYGLNYLNVGWLVRSEGSVTQSAKHVSIRQPSETILITDSWIPTANYSGQSSGFNIVSDQYSPWAGAPHARHNGAVNVAWVDGHASPVHAENSDTSDLNRVWDTGMTRLGDPNNYWEID